MPYPQSRRLLGGTRSQAAVQIGDPYPQETTIPARLPYVGSCLRAPLPAPVCSHIGPVVVNALINQQLVSRSWATTFIISCSSCVAVAAGDNSVAAR
jgi:hypothetical protein